MSYTAFTVEQVFKNNDANVACNLIYSELFAADPLPAGSDRFLLTGTPARIVQGAGLTEVSVIPFIVDEEETFNWFRNNIERLFGIGVLAYPDKLEFIWQNIYFEIWLVNDIFEADTIEGLFVQVSTNIPTNIL